MSKFFSAAAVVFIALAAGCASTPPKPEQAGGTEGNILVNGSFEQWGKDASLDAWTTAIGKDKTWSNVPFKSSKEAVEGKLSLELPDPGAEQMALAVQSIDPGKIQLGKTLTILAAVKAPEYRQLHIILNFQRNGERLKERLFNSGGADWENLMWRLEIPPDADPKSFRVEIIRHPMGPGQVLVDQVVLRFENN